MSSTVTSLSGSLLHMVGVAANLEEQEKLHGKVTETQQLLDDILREMKDINQEVSKTGCTYVHTYIHTRTRTHTHSLTHTTYTHARARTHTHTHAHTYTHTHIHTYITGVHT